jgi:hypothetical protein
LQLCDTPDQAAAYWKLHIATHPHFNPECECLAVLLLNTRRRIKGHQLVSIGTQDTILVHPREVFRLAVTTAANALILMHCHPSGESSPSEADIKVTRDLIRAGQILKIEVLDHVIMGQGNFSSLKALGFFFRLNAMTTLILLVRLSLKPSVKVSVEPSVRGYAMSSFGKVKSSKKTLAFIGEKSYIYV